MGGITRGKICVPYFYHYYQLRVQYICNWQQASILFLSIMRIMAPDTSCFAKGPSNTSRHWAVLNMDSRGRLSVTEAATVGISVNSSDDCVSEVQYHQSEKRITQNDAAVNGSLIFSRSTVS